MKTPVALIIFNRPSKTEKVFEIIRSVKPTKLLVIADGPRANHADDERQCVATRSIIEQVDWDCEVLKNYSDSNLGCSVRPATGIDWVFKQVEQAIILEDDCLPDLTFFRFCGELLEQYRDDERIMHISGNNYSSHVYQSPYSYTFSRYTLSWGWATWRRAWKHFDLGMKHWPEVRDKKLLKNILVDGESLYDWERTLQFVYEGNLDCWDFQWTFACWLRNGMSIVPEHNLVTNVGTGQDATHFQESSPLLNLPVQPIEFPLKHPPFMLRDFQADRIIQSIVYNYNLTPSQEIVRKLRKLIHKVFLLAR